MRKLYTLALAVALVLPALARAEAPVREVVSKSGIRAWLVEDKSLPLVSMQFAFEGGAALDPEGKDGLTTLLASLLDEGAGDLDSRAFQAALSERSIELGFSADEDALFGSLKTLSREKDNAFALLRVALHKPRLDVEAIERMKEGHIARRQFGMSDPNWLVSQGFEQLALASHPYGRPAAGTVASLQAITRDDLVTIIPQRLVRNRLKIAVVGDIRPAELAAALDYVFAELPKGAEKIDLPPLQISGAGELGLIAREQPQTVLMAALPGIKREDPDWFPATVMNYVLGGDFQSRLMSEIRVKRGLTYGISSALVPYKAGGVFYAMASADNAKVAELLAQLRDELGKLAKGGVTETELGEAKTYLTGSFALRFNSSSGTASVLLEIQRLGFAPSYLTERAIQIAGVTGADVARMAEQLLKPEALTVVAVGKPENLVPTRDLQVSP
jgi:zinc protease